MSLLRLVAPLFVWLAFAAPATAQTFPQRGNAPVVDAANVIDDAAEAELSAKLDAFEQRTQRQFVVATVPSLEGYEISDYGYRLGRQWGLGDTENDDGIILLVAPNERRVRIETGYGIESIIPDGLVHDIIEGEIVPRFKAGDMTGGIVAGADAVMKQLELPPEEAARVAAEAQAQPAQRGDDGFPIGTVIWFIFIFFFFILPMLSRGGRRHRRRSGVSGAIGDVILWSAINAAANSGRDHGGGWGGGGGFGGGFGGGGGFSGGGGSFGGGGASGSW